MEKIINLNKIGKDFDLNKQNVRKKYIYSLIKKSNIFLKNSNLQLNKDIIKEIFNEGNILKSILFLDFMYSTNLSKNKYSIDDIVNYINSDNFIILSNNIGENTIDEISKLKFGLGGKKAISFFTKYFFYLTNFNFPIYDSLVIKSSKIIFNKKINEKNFYLELFNLKEFYKVTFEELDGFLWLFGKIQKGSFTTFLSKNEYIKLNNNYKKINNTLNLSEFEKILNELENLKN